MRYHFNVLTEPWIPVVDLQGNRLELGILETLERAHELRGISDASPLVEYGVHRLLNVFLMDALRPEEVEDIEALLDEGQFDMEQIEEYISQCEREGASFDLFDEERPFLQCPYVEAYDKGKIRPVSKLDVQIPSGNNHIHFDHLEKVQRIPCGQAARLLTVRSLIATSGLEGPSSINASPPYFAVFRGNTLFETLANLLQPIEEIQQFDEPPVFWRCDMAVEPKKKVPKTSWLYGMLFPARRILLIPAENGIGEIYFGPGMDFCLPENWTDPHVTYRKGKEGRFPWRPNGARAVWQNLNDLVDIKGNRAPKIANVYQQTHDQELLSVPVTLYGVQTNQASYLDVYRQDLELPRGLFREGRADIIGNCIVAMEELAKRLQFTLTKKQVDKKKVYFEGITNQMVADALQSLYQSCEREFWDLCNTTLAQETVDEKAVYLDWNKRLAEIGASAMKGLVSRLNLTGKQLVALSGPLSYWDGYLYTLKTKGDESHG